MIWITLTIVFFLTSITFFFLLIKERRKRKQIEKKYRIKPTIRREEFIDIYSGC